MMQAFTLHRFFSLWQSVSSTRIGRVLFSYLIRFFNPYTGALGAQIEVLEKGYSRVSLKDKAKNRNHLNSVHAIALTNLGEFTSGIAVLTSLDKNTRGIVTHLSSEFVKKARGTLSAESRCVLPNIEDVCDYTVMCEIFDEVKDLVCRVEVTWRLEIRQ